MALSYGDLKFQDDGKLDRKHFLGLLSHSEMGQTEAFVDICELVDTIAKNTNLEDIRVAHDMAVILKLLIDDLYTLRTVKPADFSVKVLLDWEKIENRLRWCQIYLEQR